MLSLPTELWLLIGAYLSDSDLLAAIQVNRTFHSQLIRLFYRNFVICGAHGRSSRPLLRRSSKSSKRRVPPIYVKRSFAAIERLKRIQSSSMLMGAIKSCTLCHFSDPVDETEKIIADALEQVLQEGVAFISTLPHCREIVIDAVLLNNHQLKQLISPHSQLADLSVQDLTVSDGDSTFPSGSQHRCPLKNLTISGLRGSQQSVREFAEWSMSGDLRSLSVQNGIEDHLSVFHTQVLQRSFPNLRRLEFNPSTISAQVLECLPMLEELIFHRPSPPLVLTPTILPRLQTFQGPGAQARSIIPGRPIRTLHIVVDFKGLLPSRMRDVAPNFGSATPILELSVERGTPKGVIGQGRITRICPSLQILRLYPASTVKMDAVRVNGTSCQEES